jgi:phosphoserine aminotransferase
MSKYGKPNIVATSEATKFTKLPVNEGEEVQVSQDAAYFHYCANETVHGLHHSPISPFLVFPFSFRFLM